MNLIHLDNLLKSRQLSVEKFSPTEFFGLLSSGEKRLVDANNSMLAIESRFDLGYNAAHALALAALRYHGYRAQNRFIVFQVLPDTLGVGPEVWRVLAKCHDCRNLAEYEGHIDVSDQLLLDLLRATQILLEKLKKLPINAMN